jgi:hypothetical protein
MIPVVDLVLCCVASFIAGGAITVAGFVIYGRRAGSPL